MKSVTSTSSAPGDAAPHQNKQIQGSIKPITTNIPTTTSSQPLKQQRINISTKSTQTFNESYGHDHTIKQPHHYRFLFNNINGIQLSTISLRSITKASTELQVDWMGLVETHIDSAKQHVKQQVITALSDRQHGFVSSTCVFSQSDLRYDGDIKYGGVLQIATDNLASRTVKSFSDKYGRWTSQTHSGKRGILLTTITAYRVTAGSKGPTSAHAQQRAMLVTDKRGANVRQLFIQDLTDYIQQCQQSGHAIVLCLDANEIMSRKNSAIGKLARDCGLVDVHKALLPDMPRINSHRSGSSQIDYCLATFQVIECVSQAGILAFDNALGGDHRAMYFDLDIASFFKGITNNPVSIKGRAFTTKDKKKSKAFVDAVDAQWTRRHLSSRIATLSTISKLPASAIRRDAIIVKFEQIDAEITRVFEQATKSLKIPKHTHLWSPAWARAGATKRYWKARIKNVWAGQAGSIALQQLRIKYNIQDDGTSDMTTLRNRYDLAVKQHSILTKRDSECREHHLDQLIATKSVEAAYDKAAKRELAELKSLKEAEKQSKVFQKIGNTLKPSRSGGISKVELPLSMYNAMQQDHSSFTEGPITNNNVNLRQILQQTIRIKKKDSKEEWVTILDQNQLENAILLYCQEHYQQASVTPFGHGHLAALIGKSGLTDAGTQILQGTLFEVFDQDLFPELATFLVELATPEEIKALPPISHEITIEEWNKGFRQWRETTSTSPSGRHLGIYKALLSNKAISENLCEMLNIVIRLELIPTRWCKAISVLIEKDPGSPCVNRLRMIHLFEADYNFFLKLMWASRLVHRGEDTNQFGLQQYGSRSRLSALDPSMLKRLTYDLSRILRSNLGTFDNDAKSCYDRIINGIAMLASRRLGMSTEAIAVHAGVLWELQYMIKTVYGVSSGYYQSSNDAVLFGTGQGSGASPAVWLAISTILLASLQRLIQRGMRFSTPSDHISVERMSDSFVDDTQNGLNDAHLPNPLSLEQLIRNLENMAQTWERLLYSSGGGLELSKCFYIIVYWKWIKGLPVMLRPSEMDHIPTIKITSGFDVSTGKFGPLTAIKQLDPIESNKSLGIRQATTGIDTDQCAYLRNESIIISKRIMTSNLTRFESYIAYRFCYIPFVSYSLGTTTLQPKQLQSISSHATGSFLTKMGINKNFPRAAAFGPIEFGGLALFDLHTEQGVLQIKMLMEHVYHSTETGKLIMIEISHLQMESGISQPILTNLLQSIPYITPCWITSLRDFLYIHNISLEFTDGWNHRLTRQHDRFIMDVLANKNYTAIELRHINAVRLHLQVATLSEIATADGKSITVDAIHGVKSTIRTSELPNWIRQPATTKAQRILWKSALETHFLRGESQYLHSPLGEWIDTPTQKWPSYYDAARQVLLRRGPDTVYEHMTCVQSSRLPRHVRLFDAGTLTGILNTNIPQSAVPADFEVLVTGQYQASFSTARKGQNQILDHLPPTTVDEYVLRLSPVRKRLLAYCTFPAQMTSWNQVAQHFRKIITTAKDKFECATDGGLQQQQGTFGWVATGAKIHFQSGAGPVDGDPETSSSTRSEWFGYAGLLEAVLMLQTIFICTNTNNVGCRGKVIHTWIDNKAVADNIIKMLTPYYTASREYPHDADIISHIRWIWEKMPQYQFTAGWVRSHQDKDGTVPFSSLPANAQLNVMADELATHYFHHGLIRPRPQPLFFPSVKVSLIVNRQRVTAQYSDVIRFHVNGTKHKLFLQSTHKNWSIERVWNTIDMQGIGLAFKTMSKPQQQATSKMMHGWWNTGHQRAKITKGSKSDCPCCAKDDETTEHILCCKAPSSTKERYLALITLRLAGKVNGLTSQTWEILYCGIILWLNNEDNMPPISLQKYALHPDHRILIQQAIDEQTLIGWKYACRGYLSTKWVAAQSFGKPNDTVTRTRQTWLRNIIKALWHFTHTMWTHRNTILHGKEETAKAISESSVDQRIKQHYAEQLEYAVSDQIIFDLPLTIRLKRPLRSKKHWLVLAGRYHPTTRARKKGNQPLLTRFFDINIRSPPSPRQRRNTITRDHQSRQPTKHFGHQTRLTYGVT